jgi:hypothetical protein
MSGKTGMVKVTNRLRSGVFYLVYFTIVDLMQLKRSSSGWDLEKIPLAPTLSASCRREAPSNEL